MIEGSEAGSGPGLYLRLTDPDPEGPKITGPTDPEHCKIVLHCRSRKKYEGMFAKRAPQVDREHTRQAPSR